MNAWEPISTAPKDGSIILAWREWDQHLALVLWDNDWWDANDTIQYKEPPTHWMKIPRPPGYAKAADD